MTKFAYPFLAAVFIWIAATAGQSADLEQQFRTPPDSARPWVYCFALEGNITREGITADLEAMQRAGIGGLLFMDGGMGNPPGPHRFMSDSWIAQFKHLVAEADRLGLQINLNNDPGWAGSGGPWIMPELAAQKVVMSETVIEGPKSFDAALPQPPAVQNFYRDIAVLACPAPEPDAQGKFHRIENFDSTKSFAGGQDFAECVPWPRFIPTNPNWSTIPPAQCVASAKVQNLTGRMDNGGRLKWNVPPGRWLVLRIGHTLAGGITRSTQPEAAGLECDKMSKKAVETHFAAMVGKLLTAVGPLAGKTIVSTHIDSWEAGSGNWTDGFREEFRRRRGYDLFPYLPTLNGLVVDSLEISERFLWDYRETVCEMLLENYAGCMKDLAHKNGLRLSIEGYDGTCDDLRFIGRADEPMCEFWQRGCYTGLPLSDLVEEVASAAHVYGRRIMGAEAFTNWRGDFLDHPATLKPLGDWAFAAGVNKFYYSEWILQPWPDRVPGVSFLFIGTVFHRSLTWWEQSKPWHEYVARCQQMLRQGRPVADVCFVASEGAPLRFVPPIPTAQRGIIPDRPEYNFDGCPPELILGNTKVQDGRVTLPSGMSYRLLVLPTYNADDRPVLHIEGNYVYTDCPLPKVQTMTPELLQKVKRLVEAGATVLGYRPLKSPSFVNFPECDRELTQLADELWGKDAGAEGRGEHHLGRGRVVWGRTPEEILAGMNVPPDFSTDPALKGKLLYTHRALDDGRQIYFVANKRDDVVQGDCVFRASGQPEMWHPQTGQTEPIPHYRPSQGTTHIPLRLDPYESVFVVFHTDPNASDPVVALTHNGQNVFAPPPARSNIRIQKALYGVLSDPARTRDVTAKVQAIVDGGETRFPAWRLGWLDDPALQATKSVQIDYTLDGKPRNLAIVEGNTIALDDAADPLPTARLQRAADGTLRLEAWQNGSYELQTASGRKLHGTVKDLSAPQTIDGPWELRFPANSGATKFLKLDALTSWNNLPEPTAKYFSGTATYRKSFRVPAEALAPGRSIYLDLGKVAVMAQLKINGQDLGALWKSPFRCEITSALKQGDNLLEVQVTNLLPNRLIGDEQLPEDSDRDPNGALKSWPKWLQENKPSPAGRRTFATYRVWKKDFPLQASGLLGPVKLYTTQNVNPQ